MERITQEMLDRKIALLNKTFGFPTELYTKDANGNFTVNRDTFHIESGYGAVGLGQGDFRVILEKTSKRELYGQLCAMLQAVTLRDMQQSSCSLCSETCPHKK